MQILRLISILQNQGHAPQVIADKTDRYEDVQLKSLVDRIPAGGPLSGLLSALENRLEIAGPGWAFVLACDQVVWRHCWFAELVNAITPLCSAVCFTLPSEPEQEPKPFIQPIPGLYHTNCLSAFEAAFLSDDRSLKNAIRLVKHERIPLSDNPSCWSFNAPEELQQILKRLAQGAK
jgi:molybdopterin-guanine dinucleotide biosynthesis protein A